MTAIETIKNYVECYDKEKAGCDYRCGKCGLAVDFPDLIKALRVIIDDEAKID